MRLKNRIAIVTGGSQGIGEAICYDYANEGATVIVVNNSKPKAGLNVANNIIAKGGKAEAFVCDVANSHSINKLIEYVHNKYDRIDILVNNAGVAVFKKFEEHSEEDWNYVIDVNLKGPFLLSKAVIPKMKEQKYGKIIFVSSVAASVGHATIGPYSASKGGLLAMARSMVSELAPFNINVNSVSPGYTETPINQVYRNDPNFVKMVESKTPRGIAYMQAKDISGAAVFLASDEAQAVHGMDLIVDNGLASSIA
jgi:NAD(P)-dependent dehydrogenase (short-subunit alcohol dehydrogenase family)